MSNYQFVLFILLEVSISEFFDIALFSKNKSLVLFSLIMKQFDIVFFLLVNHVGIYYLCDMLL